MPATPPASTTTKRTGATTARKATEMTATTTTASTKTSTKGAKARRRMVDEEIADEKATAALQNRAEADGLKERAAEATGDRSAARQLAPLVLLLAGAAASCLL
eukprot:gnl/TRDRNA2_/TRDRNA2_166440_c0_seq2.p2 gnl/TRDRNA2_/TRDRNA2_166440_c0~~gnl/TRDRNA2_/TRDRNA2_166440_c0_seq2.p2  ORF type:complete len:104 (+),score=19.72 gnl/TRDRNA2_/TRDRNA2_166440_c0_seq2:100-411(+)